MAVCSVIFADIQDLVRRVSGAVVSVLPAQSRQLLILGAKLRNNMNDKKLIFINWVYLHAENIERGNQTPLPGIS